MTLTVEQRLNAARRLIDVADPDMGRIVTNYGIGYANGDTGAWVAGDWNDKSSYDSEARTRTVTDSMPSRLANALEKIGVDIHFYDEVDTCSNCQRLYFTQPGYHGNIGNYIVLPDGDTLCRDCAIAEKESLIDEMYANNHERAVTWLCAADLVELGWRDALPDEYDAEHGFHSGQTDTPASVLAYWRAVDDQHATRDYLFFITDVGQFDVHYRLFVRDNDDETGE